MADEVFKVGTRELVDESLAGFMFKNATPKITSKKDEVLDHRGNPVARQNFDERLVVSVEAVLPRGVAVNAATDAAGVAAVTVGWPT